MYQGKSTCETLKSIRKQIADANDIPYEPVVCTHQGDCMGTCPACESEMRYIENQLNIRKSNGKDIKLDRLASDLVYSPKKHITGKHGTVIVEFVVERDGSISDIEVVQGIDPILKAAVAHLWFVAIHPFDDGNGRITRTITDMLLAKADGMPHRFYSMSAEILRERKGYYAALEKVTTGTTDITTWLDWFLQTLRSAILRSEKMVQRVVRKSLFWQQHREVRMNERQVKIVNMLWDGFEGKLTTSKWAKISKTSQATALRDVSDLVEKGVLIAADAGGRSTNYLLKDDLE